MNKNGEERLNENTPVPEEIRLKLVERLVNNYKVKDVEPRQRMWGTKTSQQNRKDKRVRFLFVRNADGSKPCACGLGCELGNTFMTGALGRSMEDRAAIRLRRMGFSVTKEFCEGFVSGFDSGDDWTPADASAQYSAGRKTGAEVWNRVKPGACEVAS